MPLHFTLLLLEYYNLLKGNQKTRKSNFRNQFVSWGNQFGSRRCPYFSGAKFSIEQYTVSTSTGGPWLQESLIQLYRQMLCTAEVGPLEVEASLSYKTW